MVLYRCERCGFSTTRTVDFRRHMERKRPCTRPVEKDTKDFPCPTCYRIFKRNSNLQDHTERGCDRRPSQYACTKCMHNCETRQGLYIHRNKCSGGAAPAVTGRCALPEDMQLLVSLEEQIHQLKERLRGTMPPSVQIHHTTNHVSQNTTNHITHNTQNIILNFDIGSGTQYDTSHMTPQTVGRILHKFRPELLPQASHHFLQLIYSNPANRNVLKNSFYSKICDVFMDHEWRSMPEVEVLKMLTYDVFSAILETYEQMEKAKMSEEHAEILNLIVSEEEPYEPKACEAMRAALVDVTKQFHCPTPRTSKHSVT